MPLLKGRMMLRRAREEMQVYQPKITVSVMHYFSDRSL